MDHDRKLNRLPGYDYSQNGWYYVTIDCRFMRQWFGKINDIRIGHGLVRALELNECGLIASKYWKNIPDVYPEVVLDNYVIMPNHVHGIIQIKNNNVGTGHWPVRTMGIGNKCLDKIENVGTGHWPVRTMGIGNFNCGKLSKIINGYKGAVTKEIRDVLGIRGFEWHRSFYDEIIRDEQALNRIRKYIIENPKNFAAKSR